MGFRPFEVLKGLETGETLTGRQLREGARALTALELRPQLHGYRQLANQLGRERNEETAGLKKLGGELQGNVAGAYGNIANANAQGIANLQSIGSGLTQQSSQIAADAAKAQEAMQQGAVGDLNKGLEMRGAAPGGSAQEALAQAVAQQNSAQASDSAASRNLLAQQAAGASQLGALMAGSTQMQGGAAVGGIGREIASRTGQSNQKYGEAIQQALGKLADVKATKGATFTKNLLELRGGEQQFLLGKAAVAGEKQKLALEQEENAEDRKQQSFENKLSLAKLGLDRWKAHHPNAGEGEVHEKKQEIRQDKKEVRALIPGLVAEFGSPPADPKQLNLFIAKMNSKASADPTVVKKVVKAWWEKRYRNAAKDPNGASYGR